MVYDIMVVNFMKTTYLTTLFLIINLAFAALYGFGAVSEIASHPLSHYSVILERAPFGPLPQKASQDGEGAGEGGGESEEVPSEVPEEEIPPSFEQIKVTAMTMFGGKPAAGFTDGAANKSYYLREGEEFESYTLVNVDFDGMEITLRKDAIEAVLPLWINPATTNCADISSFGVSDPSALSQTGTVAKAAVAQSPTVANNNISSEEQKERERRREEWRKKRDEERERRRKELEAMTPEEREQHLRKVNMDLIRSGDGPPLPIELNQEEMEQLASEGFAVPGINAPAVDGAPGAADRPRGRRSRRFGPPMGNMPNQGNSQGN